MHPSMFELLSPLHLLEETGMGLKGCFSTELLCGVKERLQDISAGRSGEPKISIFQLDS